MSALQRISGTVAALSLLVVPATLTAQRAGTTTTQAKSTTQSQESRSAALVPELTRLLAAQNLDSIATAEAESSYVGALYIPGSQLLVVRAKYPGKEPPPMEE